jgi:hypothetical protein
MALKDLLLKRAGSLGSLAENVEATEKAFSSQLSSLSSRGSHENAGGGANTDTEGGEPKNFSRDPLFGEATKATEATSLKTREEFGSLEKNQKATEATDPIDWQCKIEDVAPQSEPEPAPLRPSLAPVSGSLVQRLVAAGASFDTYGSRASIRAPAGIPLELVQSVEARGWRIIPGGKPNPEAEHDSWLAGVPIADLSRGR